MNARSFHASSYAEPHQNTFPSRTGIFPKSFLNEFVHDVEELFTHTTSSYDLAEKGGRLFFRGALPVSYAAGPRPVAHVTIIPNSTHASASLDFQPDEGSWELIIPTDEFTKKYDELGNKYGMQKETTPHPHTCPCNPSNPGPCAGSCPRYASESKR